MELTSLLQDMIDSKASDIFIVAGLPLTCAIDGRQQRLGDKPLMPADTEKLIVSIYEAARRDMAPFVDAHNHDDDFSFALAMPLTLPPPWLPSVPMRTPAKPTAQPRVFAGVIRSALP